MDALAAYGSLEGAGVARFIVEDSVIRTDTLDEVGLRRWVDGRDPVTDERRGRDLMSPDADLLLDGTINAPKSYSIAAMIDPDLAAEFEALQDRLRDRVITLWQRELNARRGAGGRIREALRRVEVVELQHRRSRALDPHIHRHLWLNVKVRGEDGKWSNVDSRVAMKFHTVVNAEGELAARTDPRWIAALARRGFTVNADGEVAELVHAVRPLSRRSTQIEANRAVLLATWRSEHPGAEPSPDQLHQIDRLAWARARPNKPGDVDEAAWEQLIADELAAIDPTILRHRGSIMAESADAADLDVGLLAARAVVEADARSAGCGGRFSLLDVRAGAIRAVAASGIVADRSILQPVIDDVTAGALRLTVDLLPDESVRPDHVKGFMASATAALKVELATRFEALARAGVPVDDTEVRAVADEVVPVGVVLDDQQVCAAGAIAGTDALVSVTGPAGAGKTTMLRVAATLLAGQRRRMLVVAPTKKAASVAGRELGTSASSLHALLADYGFRWGRDDAGADIWIRLRPGDADPATGRIYTGVRGFPLNPGDRVVVDEAGMVDLHTANALAIVAAETGAGVAMVGDHLQARPVGHSGAMASLTRRATAVVELSAVHRFDDPEYAALTLRMREPGSKEAALEVASALHEQGLIRRVADHERARDVMVEAYFRFSVGRRRVALVTSTNDEADAVNETIQQRLVDTGRLQTERIAVGQGEQRLLEGDVVQTRRNDRDTGVENRALWAIRRIGADVELVSLADSGDVRRVSRDYAAQHVHLAYASTVHGIQGETTDVSIVGPGVDAAGLYVGMTRGRAHNETIAIAGSDQAAVDKLADSMLRGVPEVSVEDSQRAARVELGRAARSPAEAQIAEGELAWLDDWLRNAEHALLDLEGRVASERARAHGRMVSSDQLDDLEEAHRRLAAVREAETAPFEDLARQYEQLGRASAQRGQAADHTAPTSSTSGQRSVARA